MQEDLGIVLERFKVQLNNLIENYRSTYNIPGYIMSRALSDELIRLKDIEIMESAVQLDKIKKALDNTVQQQAKVLERKEIDDGKGISDQSQLAKSTE